MSRAVSCRATSFDIRLILGDVVFLKLVALGAEGVVSVGDDAVRRLFLNLELIVPFSPLQRPSYFEVEGSNNEGIVLACVYTSQATVCSS